MSNILIPGIGFQYDSLGTLTNGLVSYYNMQGNSNDIWGTNNGTDTSVTYGTAYGKVNEGGDYNGSTSYTSLGAINLGTNLTVALWGYVAATPSDWTSFLGKQYTTGGNPLFSYALQYVYSGSNLYVNANITNGSSDYGIGYALSGGYNAWHFYVETYDGSTLKLYVDGVLVNSSSISITVGYNSSVPTLISQHRNAPDTTYLNGYIDEVALYNRALTSAEISELYNSGAGQTMVGNIFDTESLSENVSIQESALPIIISVFDTETVIDIPVYYTDQLYVLETIDIEIAISTLLVDVYDAEVVADVPVIRILFALNVYDVESIIDVPVIKTPLLGGVSVYDLSTVTESVSIQIPILGIISVYDSDATTENVTIQIPLLGIINTYDIESVVDVIEIKELSAIDIYDAEVVTESITLHISEIISVYDSENIIDTSVVLIPNLTLSVYDIDIATDVVFFKEYEFVIDYDIVNVADVPTIVIPILHISTEEIENVVDVLTIKTLVLLSVSDTESIAEFISLHESTVISTYDSDIVVDASTIKISEGINVYDTENEIEAIILSLVMNASTDDVVIVVDVPIITAPYIPPSDISNVVIQLTFGPSTIATDYPIATAIQLGYDKQEIILNALATNFNLQNDINPSGYTIRP